MITMKKMINSIINAIEDINEAKTAIEKEQNKMNVAKQYIAEKMKDKKFKSIIDDALLKNMNAGELEAIEKEREEARRNSEEREKAGKIDPMTGDYYSTSFSYHTSTVFDPISDEYEICGYSKDENGRVKFVVECVKLRHFLGISGCWVPTCFSTTWINNL